MLQMFRLIYMVQKYKILIFTGKYNPCMKVTGYLFLLKIKLKKWEAEGSNPQFPHQVPLSMGVAASKYLKEQYIIGWMEWRKIDIEDYDIRHCIDIQYTLSAVNIL